MKIGIFGGSFDPIHLGHIHLANEVLRQVNLDKILFLPCHASPFIKNITATPAQRLAMLELALEEVGEVKFVADSREIERQGLSYTFDTLESLRREFPGAKLYLLLGRDAFEHITSWHNFHGILSLAHLLVADRCSEDTVENDVRPVATFVKINSLPISSSLIRKLCKTHDVRAQQFLPVAVWQYILKHNIYL